MAELRIEIRGADAGFSPGAKLQGSVLWRGDQQPGQAELALLWRTEGRGSMDSAVVARQDFPTPRSTDERAFLFELPLAPYSCSGKLISLIWSLELVLKPGDVIRRDFILAPEGQEIVLPADPGE